MNQEQRIDVFRERREEFSRKLADGVAIVPAAVHARRNADSEYAYRQDSDFHYLTGFGEPEAVLVLAPNHATERTVLFVRPHDRTQEIWTGRRAGVEGAVAAYGADAAYPIDELDKRLPQYLVGASAIYYGLGRDERFDRRVFEALAAARTSVRRAGRAPHTFVEPGTILHEMRVIKRPEELALMRRAAAITGAGFDAGMRATRPGLWEYELQAAIEHRYRVEGAFHLAYTSIVAGGDNATILHYNTNDQRLHDGDLVLVDSGSEYETYASDVTRTWPVNGHFSAEQRAIYDIVLAAQKAGIARVRAGTSYEAFHDAAVRVLIEGLIGLGLLEGSVDESLETGSYKEYYPHRTGHYLGLDVHDVGRYRDADDAPRTLERGMVVTVEPGIYVQRDHECDPRWSGIGVRIEDDILCTDGEPEILTAAIPREADAIEALVGTDALTRA
jgi:Xaa-Pro aminopeptidase